MLMTDFYRADQGEEESVISCASCVEGLLPEIRDKFPDQIPLQKGQDLLKDSVKYHHTDA